MHKKIIPKKKLSQNFLIDPIIIGKIFDSLCIEDGAAVHYHDDQLKTAISFYDNKNAYNVKYDKNQLIEVPLNRIDIK